MFLFSYLFIVVFSRISSTTSFYIHFKDDRDWFTPVPDLTRTKTQLELVKQHFNVLISMSANEDLHLSKNFEKFLSMVKETLHYADRTEIPSFRLLKYVVDTVMINLDAAYIEGEKALAKLIVERELNLSEELKSTLRQMATTQKWLLNLSTNIVQLIAQRAANLVLK